MVSIDFRESLGDRFGGFVNSGIGVLSAYGEHEVRKDLVRNASAGAVGVDQNQRAVDTNGAPVNQQSTIAGVNTSTVVYVGLGVLALGGAIAIAKFA